MAEGKVSLGIKTQKWVENIQSAHKIKTERPLKTSRFSNLPASKTKVSPLDLAWTSSESKPGIERVADNSPSNNSKPGNSPMEMQSYKLHPLETLSATISKTKGPEPESTVSMESRPESRAVENNMPEKKITPEIVAEKVYRLMQRDLRLERER